MKVKRKLLTMAAGWGLSTVLLAYSTVAWCEEDAFAKWAAIHAVPMATLDLVASDADRAEPGVHSNPRSPFFLVPTPRVRARCGLQ